MFLGGQLALLLIILECSYWDCFWTDLLFMTFSSQLFLPGHHRIPASVKGSSCHRYNSRIAWRVRSSSVLFPWFWVHFSKVTNDVNILYYIHASDARAGHWVCHLSLSPTPHPQCIDPVLVPTASWLQMTVAQGVMEEEEQKWATVPVATLPSQREKLSQNTLPQQSRLPCTSHWPKVCHMTSWLQRRLGTGA